MPSRKESISKMVLIGEGATGRVYKAIRKRKCVAVKLVNISDTGAEIAFRQECETFRIIRKQVGYRYVAKIYSTHESETEASIIMKLYPRDLFDFMQHTTLSERSFRPIFKRLCKGLCRLHRAGIAHLDIKPENILLKKFKPYFADFGSAVIRPNANCVIAVKTKYFTGTLAYAAPETSRDLYQTFDPFPADVFSLGVILHVAITSHFPWSGPIEDMNKSVDLSLAHQYLSTSAYNLLQRMLTVNPIMRPTMNEILGDSWFKA
jgi:serine/threonine protein kinase